MNLLITWEQSLLIMELNNCTEHYFGSGPLEDSFLGDGKKIRQAIRRAKRAGFDTTDFENILL